MKWVRWSAYDDGQFPEGICPEDKLNELAEKHTMLHVLRTCPICKELIWIKYPRDICKNHIPIRCSELGV